jgi:hypothetical protein
MPMSPKNISRGPKAKTTAKVRSLAPDLAIRIGSTPKTKFRGKPGIFGRLLEDHDRHRALFSLIEQTVAGSPQRKKLFYELVREVKGHAAAEEQALWSTILRHPSTTDEARHAIAEHKEIDEMFEDLAARDMASRGWLKRFNSAKQEYLHHIREEEQEQFVTAEKQLTPADTRFMQTVFERRKREEKATAEVKRKIKLAP